MQTGNKVEELKSVLQGRKEAEQAKLESKELPSQKHHETEELRKEAQGNYDEKLQALEAELNKANALAQENQDKYVRLYAEFENYRKRVQKDKEEIKFSSEEKMIREILPMLDDLQLALQSAATSSDLNAVLEGMKLMQKQAQSSLEKLGVEIHSSLGKAFDPHLHEAVSQQVVEGKAPNIVVQEFRVAYKYKGKLIRPAMVVVSA